MESDFEKSSEESSTVLDDVGHVRDQTESLELPIFQVGFEQHEHFRGRLVEEVLIYLNELALTDQLLQLCILLLPRS